MTAPRTVLVMNPQSQNGALGRKWPHLAPILRRELGSFEDLRTGAPGDAARLTREALASGAERIVAMGGDGTISEVVDGFFAGGEPVAPGASLAVVPFGTGGDFRKSLGIPNHVAEAARIVRAGHTRAIDAGKLEYTTRAGQPATRVFVNIASFGISGVVDRLVNSSSKRLGGRVAFLFATARAALQYSNQRVHLSFEPGDAGDPGEPGESGGSRDSRDSGANDASVDMTINTVAVANGRYFGGGMFIAPEAELDDGYFDVVAIGDVGVREMVRNSRRIYRGTHLTLDKVSHRRARVVRAEPAVPGEVVELDVDGETPGVLPATFTVLPAALTVIAPPAG